MSKDEINEVFKRVEMETFNSETLKNKMTAAFESDSDQISIELSEDELEFILDEIIIPAPQFDTEHTDTLRSKIQSMLNGFRASEMH